MSNRDFDILPTGQLWFTRAMLGAFSQGISDISFRVLTSLSAISGASFHTKPRTDSCETAVIFRVPNDYEINGIGVDLECECKGRIFMAQSVTGEPVIIACFYNADSELIVKNLATALPKHNGDSLIKLPHSLAAKSKLTKYDPLDILSLESPYQQAADLLNLGLGQINPLSMVLRAQELGVNLICVYDKRLAEWDKPLTNNAGSRVLGTYVPNGVDYIELAIAHAKNVELAGVDCSGYIVADVAQIDQKLEAPTGIRAIYEAADSYKEAVAATRNGGSAER